METSNSSGDYMNSVCQQNPDIGSGDAHGILLNSEQLLSESDDAENVEVAVNPSQRVFLQLGNNRHAHNARNIPPSPLVLN